MKPKLKQNDQNKPQAAISIDMDNQWSYMKTHGEPGWEKFSTYFDVLVPCLLDVLDELELSITFFLVGIDVQRGENQRYIEMIAQRGHEPGNHSLTHEPWLHLYPRERIASEIVQTHQRIVDVMGTQPRGFRGPGFSWSADLLEVLVELGYQYDASTLPTFIGPLARLYYFRTARLNHEERKQRKRLFGTLRDGFRPVKPFNWQFPDGRKLLELPVTTIPILRIPFHLSYLLFLSRRSARLMETYLELALTMCRATATQPSFLLHPLDLLGGDQISSLQFFPGMDIDGSTKRQQFKKVMKSLRKHFQLVNMSEFAESQDLPSLATRRIPDVAG